MSKSHKFSNSKDITWSMAIGQFEDLGYDMIILKRFIIFLNMIIDLKYLVIYCDENGTPMNTTKSATNNRK